MSNILDERKSLKEILEAAQVEVSTAIERVDTKNAAELAQLETGTPLQTLKKLRKPLRIENSLTTGEIVTYSDEDLASNIDGVCPITIQNSGCPVQTDDFDIE